MNGWRSKFLIGSNHKMFKNTSQTLAYLKELEMLISDGAPEDLHLFILTPFTALPAAIQQTQGRAIHIGAQNMYCEDAGQFTGEISPLFLKEIGTRLVMAGHSERRHGFGESDSLINRKVLAGLEHGFTVLVCVGETAQDRQYGITSERVREQVKIALHGVKPGQMSNLWIAYEPVWAIGLGSTAAPPEYADSVHHAIHDVITELYPGRDLGVPVLYGGSIDGGNAAGLLEQPFIDGLFMTRYALEARNLSDLIHNTYPIWKQKSRASVP